MSGNINLNSSEKNLLTQILYDEKKERTRNHIDTRPVDNLIDKTLGRVTLYHRDKQVVSMFNGVGNEDISIGGIFESEHGRFKVQDIDGQKIKVNGNWHHKSEFETAIVTRFSGKLKGMDR